MAYDKTDENLFKKISEIISCNGEAFAEHYIKRSVQNFYFIFTISDFVDLLKLTNQFDFITIYKNRQLPVRGKADDVFVEKVLSEYSRITTDYYAFFDYLQYPNILDAYGAGSTLDELTIDLDELAKEYRNKETMFCFGADPRPIYSKLKINEDNNYIIVNGTGP